jgi:hypothetical protein
LRILHAVQRQAELLQIIRAPGSIGRFANFLHRRQKQADKHGYDGDHHQQLEQREPRGAADRIASGLATD